MTNHFPHDFLERDDVTAENPEMAQWCAVCGLAARRTPPTNMTCAKGCGRRMMPTQEGCGVCRLPRGEAPQLANQRSSHKFLGTGDWCDFCGHSEDHSVHNAYR